MPRRLKKAERIERAAHGQVALLDHTLLFEAGQEPWRGLALTDPDELWDFKLQLLQLPRIGIDFETTGLNTRTCRVVGLAVGWGDLRCYLPTETLPGEPHLSWEEDVKPFLEELVESGIPLQLHNCPYDFSVGEHQHVASFPPPLDQWEDSMILAYVTNPHKRKGLKVLKQSMLGESTKTYSEVVGKEKILSRVPLEQAAEYACDDILMMQQIVPPLVQELKDKGLEKHYAQAKRQVPMVMWMHDQGMPVDREFLLTERKSAQKARDELLEQMEEQVFELASCSVEPEIRRGAREFGLKLGQPDRNYLLDMAGVKWEDDLRDASWEELRQHVAGYDEESDSIDWDEVRAHHLETKRIKNDPKVLNIRSSDAMTHFLFETCNLEAARFEDTKKGISKPMLIRLRRDGQLVLQETEGEFPKGDLDAQRRIWGGRLCETYLKLKKVDKLLVGFYDAILKRLVQRDGWWWCHTTFNPFATATGRWASADPNLQNQPNASPKDPRWMQVRGGFAAPPGYKLVVADLSQIELRLLAHFSKDPNLIRVYETDGDVHCMTGAKLAGMDYEEFFEIYLAADKKKANEWGELEAKVITKRKQSKPANFGLSYMMSADSFVRYAADAYDVWFTREEGQEFHQGFFDLYPGITGYHHTILQRIMRTPDGNVPTIFGRRAYFDQNLARLAHMGIHSRRTRRDPNYRLAKRMWRQAVNFPIQGSAADLILNAMQQIYDLYYGTDVRLVSQVHDEVILLVPEHRAAEVEAQVQRIMDSVATLRVPVKSSVKQARTWMDAH